MFDVISYFWRKTIRSAVGSMILGLLLGSLFGVAIVLMSYVVE